MQNVKLVTPAHTSLYCTCGGDVAAETQQQPISFTHGDLGRGLQQFAVALRPQLVLFPAELPAGQGGHQETVGLVLPPLEDDGDRVAAYGLLQLLGQGGVETRLQRGEETNHQQPERKREWF